MEKTGEKRVIHRTAQINENAVENTQDLKRYDNNAEMKRQIKKWIKRCIKIAILIACFLYLQHTYKLLNQYNNVYFSSISDLKNGKFYGGIDLDDDDAVDYKNTHLKYIDSEWNDDTAVFNFKFTNNGDKSVSFNQIYSVVCIDLESRKNSSLGRATLQAELDIIGKSIAGDLHKSSRYDGMMNVEYKVPVGKTVDVHVCFDVSDVADSGVLMLVKPKYYFALLLEGSAFENIGHSSIVNLGNGGQP